MTPFSLMNEMGIDRISYMHPLNLINQNSNHIKKNILCTMRY